MPATTSAVTRESAYDVAISFLAADTPIAEQLHARLNEVFKVFYFPRNQEELAGTNGLETMREPFFDARVVVVLYRNEWGKTPWTGVEQTAIGERCLQQGWSGLMFVNLDKTSTHPRWVPNTHVRFSYEDYGLDQLVGAIKARVQEQGGELAPPTALARAQRVQREAQYLADRDKLMRDQSWIRGTVHASIQAAVVELGRLCAEANSAYGFQIKFVPTPGSMSCVLRSGYVSVAVTWHQPLTNYVGDNREYKCHLRVTEYSGIVLGSGESGWVMQKPRQLKDHQFQVDVSETRELVWKPRGKKEHITTGALADGIMSAMLELISRANRGLVTPPDL